METIAEAVFAHYNHAEAETIPWDSEDKCYVGDTLVTYDLVHDDRISLPSERDDVLSAIIDSLGDNVWCDRNFASLNEEARYRFGWESFCRTVKHEIRYLFHTKEPEEFEDAIPVAQMLDEIAKLINDYGLVRELPAGTKFVRVRVHNHTEVCTTASSLGPPPPERTKANRMSPAGISLFYAATDLRTARAETIPTSETVRECFITSAEWTTKGPLTMLDLTNLPPLPSFYNANAYFELQHGIFLRQFISDLSTPIVHDGREHTEYVPTQILTEYFRLRFTTTDGKRLDGILYPSAKIRKGVCVVLFYGWDYFDPERLFRSDDVPIELVPESIKTGRVRCRPARPDLDTTPVTVE